MSLYRTMLRYCWPQNTMRAAYLQWQAQDHRWTAARQRLARQYLETRQQAQQVQIEAEQGILRAARLSLEHPLESRLLKVKDRLDRVFALRGHGLFRRLPPPLEVDLSHYAAGVETICRSYGELVVRMRLAQTLMTIFARNQEFSSPHFFHLALISPESAWLCFHLRQKRLQDHWAIQDYLSEDGELQKQSSQVRP